MAATTTTVAAVCALLCLASCARSDTTLLSKVSNDLIPKLYKTLPDSKRDNLVFSSAGLVQNLAVLCELSKEVRPEVSTFLGLKDTADLDKIRDQFQHVLSTFELEAAEGENSTNAAGLFNYLNTNPEHKLSAEVEERLVRSFRTNVNYDTSLEGGWFSASADTGVLSHWRELEALAVFTFLQHSNAAPFRLYNGTERQVPLVPLIGRFETREDPRFSLVKLPLQANSTTVVMILPKSSDDFAHLVDNMPDVSTFLTGNPAKEMEVWLPQLLAISSLEFKPVMQRLGLKELFKADFSKVTRSPEPLRLASISQKSFFSTSFNSIKSITESGAHFTADDGVVAASRGEAPEGSRRRRAAGNEPKSGPSSLVFNQPFLFMIERVDLGLVLTAGCVNDPVQFPQIS